MVPVVVAAAEAEAVGDVYNAADGVCNLGEWCLSAAVDAVTTVAAHAAVSEVVVVDAAVVGAVECHCVAEYK